MWQSDYDFRCENGLCEIALVHYAMKEKKREIVKWLVEVRGCDVNVPKAGYTPLQLAVERKDTDMVKFLLRNGAKVCLQPCHEKYRGFCTVKRAIEKGEAEILDMILEANASECQFIFIYPSHLITR